MKKRQKEISLHLSFIVGIIVLVGIVSFFRWPTDVTGASVRSTSCVAPTSGMSITADTLLCTGTYSLDRPLQIHGDHILFDCDHAVLSGQGGQGMQIGGQGIIVKDCTISSFNEGVILEPEALVVFEGVRYDNNGQNVVQQ
jgi:hypothetical protein